MDARTVATQIGALCVACSPVARPTPVADDVSAVQAVAPWPPATGSGPCSPGMVRIGGGSFTLGMRGDEVDIAPLCIDRTEVTTLAYRGCVDAGHCKPSMRTIFWPSIGEAQQRKWSAECNGRFDDRDQHPANCVDWTEATAFCEARGARLPTEAEWEWVARGGEAAHPYPWGTEPPNAELANLCGAECQDALARRGLKWARIFDADDGFAFTAPVGRYPQGNTPSDVADIGGNVFEWMSTDADAHPPAPSRYQRPGQKIARGGAFRSTDATSTRVELRVAVPPTIRNTYGGFRCASPAK